MPNRIYYASHAVGIATVGSNSFTTVHGLQSVGINTKFNLEQVFELGQLAIYANLENIPDVEITLEKCLDGFPLIYHLATQGAASSTLAGRSTKKCTVGLSIWDDALDSASGQPLSQCTMSGVFLSSVQYSAQIDGPAKESVTLVGNNKVWTTGVGSFTFTNPFPSNDDAPLSGIVRRAEVLWHAYAKMPVDIPGVQSSGTIPTNAEGFYKVSVQSIQTGTNLGREPAFQLGRKGPFFRFAQFPTEVKTDIEVLSTDGDLISSTEAGVNADGSNLTDRSIRFEFKDGTRIDCGSRNKLASVTYGGGNAGTRGGNVTVKYSYSNFNDMTVTHKQDPTTALRW